MRKFSCLVPLLALFQSAALAQWDGSVKTDPFTDEVVSSFSNKGTILDGDAVSAQLRYEKRSEEVTFYLSSAFPFECIEKKKPEILVRFGNSPAEEAEFRFSAERAEVDFASPGYMALKMSQHGSMMLRIVNGCEKTSTIRFDGVLTKKVSDFEVLQKSSWSNPMSGFLTKKTSDIGFSLINIDPIIPDSPDFEDENPLILVYIHKSIAKSGQEVVINIAGFSKYDKVLPFFEDDPGFEGYIWIDFQEIPRESFFQSIQRNPVLSVSIGSEQYEMSLVGLVDLAHFVR